MSYRKLSTPEDVEQWVKLNYSDDEILEITEYRNDIEFPLLWYKGDGYKQINGALRKCQTKKTEDFDIPKIQRFLNSKVIMDDIVVYRFVGLRELLKLLANTTRNREYTYPSFLSRRYLKITIAWMTSKSIGL